MSKKKGTFLDQYLDKVILGLAGLAGVYLLWAFVLSNPYGKTVGGRKYRPAEIDRSNQQQAQVILEKLQEPAKPNPYLQNKTAEFSQLLNCTISKVSVAANWPVSGPMGDEQSPEDRMYAIPVIPAMEKIMVDSTRGAVRMPSEEVTPERPYAMVAAQPADLDVVTISAHINLQSLSNNFQQSFNGPRLMPKWKDPTYAEPVFARIEMQRRIQNPDGSWGEWELVPFTRIDPYQKMYKDLPLTTEQMTFGDVTLFLNQYKNTAVVKNLLQPESYQFFNSTFKWLPPEYSLEARKIKEEAEQQKQREERDRRAAERERSRNVNRPAPGGMGGMGGMPQMMPQPQPQPGRRGGRTNEPGMMGLDPMMGMEGGMQPQRPVRPVRTQQDVEKEFAAALLSDRTKISTLKDVLVWIHDDSTRPGATYQYRVRYGVFNPIAGKNWFAPDSKQYQNQVVLWSPYAELPEPVKVPKMQHVFPMDVLANNSGVKVEIYKYYMGQWWTETFEVQPGQMIGKAMEVKPKTTGVLGGGLGGMEPGMMGGMEGAGPLLVDFATGTMLVDIVSTQDWLGTNYRPRSYPRMLYIDGSNQMFSMAARRQFWSKELAAEYNVVKQEMAQTTGPMDTMMMGPMGLPREGGGLMF